MFLLPFWALQDSWLGMGREKATYFVDLIRGNSVRKLHL